MLKSTPSNTEQKECDRWNKLFEFVQFGSTNRQFGIDMWMRTFQNQKRWRGDYNINVCDNIQAHSCVKLAPQNANFSIFFFSIDCPSNVQ